MAEQKDFYTPQEVAKLLQVSRNTVMAAARRGDLPEPERVLRRWRFPKEAIDAHVGKCQKSQKRQK